MTGTTGAGLSGMRDILSSLLQSWGPRSEGTSAPSTIRLDDKWLAAHPELEPLVAELQDPTAVRAPSCLRRPLMPVSPHCRSGQPLPSE